MKKTMQNELFPMEGGTWKSALQQPPPSKTVLAKDHIASLQPFLEKTMIGVDEAGRGPLAGDVYASAVVLDPSAHIPGVTDSKKLTAKKRETLVDIIKEQSIHWSIGIATVQEIEEWGILHATMLAMVRALAAIPNAEQYPILIDGNRTLLIPELQVEAIVQGDERVPAISAASILAKTARDAYMLELDEKYPQYGFASHKGYGTLAHQEAIEQYGVLPEHRRRFGLVKEIIAQRKNQ